MFQQKQAFTLVELIVVITILAILGTIAFISLQGYSATSRDSVRISDVSKMKTSLALFHIDAGKYPLPDNGEQVLYATELLWTQGTFGETVRQTLSRNLSEIPTDPLSENEYVYSASNTRNEFQILTLLETDLALNTINQTNAADTTRIPRIDGEYNGLFIKTSSYIVPTPSIINSEIIVGGITLNTENFRSQIIDGGDNMLSIGNVVSKTGQLDINLSVYTGSIVSDDLDSKKAAVMTAIQGAYTGSTLATEGLYKYILSKSTTEDLAGLVDTVILDNSNGAIPIVKSDCTTSTGYIYNTHEYNISEMLNGDSATFTSSGVLENNGTFTYDLTLSCDDGNYISESENNIVAFSCNTNYAISGNACIYTIIGFTYSSDVGGVLSSPQYMSRYIVTEYWNGSRIDKHDRANAANHICKATGYSSATGRTFRSRINNTSSPASVVAKNADGSANWYTDSSYGTYRNSFNTITCIN